MAIERRLWQLDLENLDRAFAHVPIATAVLEVPSTRFLRANDALAALLGYTPAELRRLRPIDLTHDDDRTIRASVPLTRQRIVEKRYLTKHGNIVHARVAFTLLQEPDDDDPGYGIAHFIDMSTEVLARNSVEQHQQLLSTLFRDAIVPMALTTKRSEPFLDVNEAFCRLLGYDRELLLTMAPDDLGPPGESERLAPRLEQAIAADRNRMTVDRRIATKDGRILDTMMNVAWTEASPRTYAWQLIDVTELNLERRARAQSEAMLRTTFDTAPIGVAVFTSGGRIGQVNAELASLLGATPECLTGEPISTAAECPLGAVLDAGFQAVVASPRDHYRDVVEFARGFETTQAEVKMCAVPSADDEVHHVVALVTDTTVSMEARRRLEDAERSKNEFIASASQELRTPLSVIVGLASELRTRLDGIGGHERNQLIEILSDQAEEMADLVEDLLTAGRLDNASLRLTPERVSLPGLVGRLVEAAAPHDAARIVVDVEDVPLVADPLRVRQILRNLVANAIRYGGSRIWIRTAPGVNDEVVIMIEDDGPGIPAAEWEDIFLPYYRSRTSTGHPAAVGLGLTVGRRLAEAMGGTLDYLCSEGRSRFTLRLPGDGSARS